MSDGTRRTPDDAVRAHAASLLDNDEVVVSWIAVAATRLPDDGGVVVIMTQDDGMPRWEAKGILIEALDHARRLDDEDGL